MSAEHDYAGWVYKRGSFVKSWKKRFMVLKSKQLSYFDSDNLSTISKAKGGFTVITVEYATDINNGLLIHGAGGRVMKIFTESADSCADWFDAITHVMVNQVMSLGMLRHRSSSASIGDFTNTHSSTSSNQLVDDTIENGCAGWLAKEGRHVKNWKRRYFSLKGPSLTYYDNANMTGVSKGHGQVCGVHLNPEKPYSIDINFEKGGRVLRVTADDQDDFERWFHALTSAVEGKSFRRDSIHAPRLSIAQIQKPMLHRPVKSLSLDDVDSYADDEEIRNLTSPPSSYRSLSSRRSNNTYQSLISSSHSGSGMDKEDDNDCDWL
jgi:hypothetical protein